MRETLTYTAIIDGEKIKVERYPPSNGLGLSTSLKFFTKTKPLTKKKTVKPVDERLHALDLLLIKAKVADDTINTIKTIQASIDQRIKELTSK